MRTAIRLAQFSALLLLWLIKPLLSEGTVLFETAFEEHETLAEYMGEGWSSTLPFEKPRYWPKGVKAELVRDVVFTGSRALMLQAESSDKIVHVRTPLLRVKENSQLKISVAMKLQEVVTGEKGWHKARLGYGTHDKHGNPIEGGYKPFAVHEGTRDWSEYEITPVLPPDAEYLIVYMELRSCRGVAWFDNLRVEVMREGSLLSAVASSEPLSASSAPLIIPRPWQEKYSGTVARLLDASLNAAGEETAKEELESFLEHLTGAAPAGGSETDSIMFILGSPRERLMQELVNSAGLSIDWAELGEQGYAVYVGNINGKQTVLLAGVSEASRFYAFQTFKQMTFEQDGVIHIHEGLVIDRPLYKIRGAVFGDLRRWYDGPLVREDGVHKFSGWPYRARFHKLKMNFVWLAGWAGHYARTVLPLNASDKKVLGDFLDDCEKYFITPSVGLRPYRQLPYPGREKGGVIYSSEEDIKGVVSNLIAMYEIGYRDLFVTFDDLPPHKWLEYEEDRERFSSIGEAHLYYIGEVYRRLKKACPDVILRVIGVAYGGGRQMSDTSKEYLREITPLPAEIEFVFTSAASSDAVYSSDLAGGREVIIWSNYYASLYEKLAQVPAVVNPYGGGDDTLHENTTGHFVLFLEDALHLSWYTASDYMWNPADYNPSESGKRGLIRSVGYGAYKQLMDYNERIRSIGADGVQGKTGTEKTVQINRVLHEMEGDLEKLQHALGPGLYQTLTDQYVHHKEFMSLLKEEYARKPLPAAVQKFTAPPVMDGRLDDVCWRNTTPLTGFLNLRDGAPADPRTEVHLGYDEENLYFGARLEEPLMANLKAVFTERGDSVFIDDSFEIFIGSYERQDNYYHIAINSLGTVYDEKRKEREWRGEYEIATFRQENAWTIELAIPLKYFDIREDRLLRFNFARNRHAGGLKEHMTYAPLFGSGFHLPQWFWVMQLE